MKTVAIIPVKYTSSRITSKNMRLLGNMPLFLHTLDKLLKIEDINAVSYTHLTLPTSVPV